MPRTQKYYKRPANSQLFHCDSFIHCVGHAVRWAIGGVGGGEERKKEREKEKEEEGEPTNTPPNSGEKKFIYVFGTRKKRQQNKTAKWASLHQSNILVVLLFLFYFLSFSFFHFFLFL